MTYNNGFPTNQVYQQVQPIQQVGYTQYGQQNQNNGQTYVQQSVQPQVFNQVVDDRVKVNGLENAKLYPIAPNTTVTLWDIDDKTFYRVSAGLPIKVYEYSEKKTNIDVEKTIEDIQQDFDFSEYVKLDDLQDIVDRMISEKLNTEIIEPQSDIKEVQSRTSTRNITRKKGDK